MILVLGPRFSILRPLFRLFFSGCGLNPEVAMRSGFLIRHLLLSASILCGLVLVGRASAAPPWAKLIPYTKVDADPDKDYELIDSNGPWMIMCTSFTGGEQAEQQAHALVIELREKYKLEAYKFRQHFDMGKPEVGLGVDKYGHPKIMRNNNAYRRDEIAVLVGNFHSVEQPEVNKALQNIKTLRPEVLTGEKTLQSWGNLRGMYSQTRSCSGRKNAGQWGMPSSPAIPCCRKNTLLPRG